MRLVSWEWFLYVVIGFVMGGGLVFMVSKLKAKEVKLLWFEWVLGGLFLFIFMFMGQTFIASFNEFEPRAAWMTIVFMGFPMVLIGAALARSIRHRLKV